MVKKSLEAIVPNIRLAPKPPDKMDRLFTKTKDKQQLFDQSGMVYQVNCGQCDAIYIGETKQRLGVRMSQHKRDCRPSKKNVATPSTALAKHSFENDHSFDLESPNVLYRSAQKRRIQLQEVNHIVMLEDKTCNFKQDTDGVSSSYYGLLKRYNKKSRMSTMTGRTRNQIHIERTRSMSN